jgi:alkylation response protein AidB-like acyl-CoA dehydrogenase
MGHTGGGHCEIRLTDVRVPRDHLLGGRGEGFVVAQKRLGPGRIFHCMRWLGQAQRAFELLCERANSRFAHGSLLAEKGEIQRWVAESAAEIQAARLMTLDAAGAGRGRRGARRDRAHQVLGGGCYDVIDRAIQVHGARRDGRHAARVHVPRGALRAHLRRPGRGARMTVARRLLRDPLGAAPWA